jgi:hypothetical protein
MGFGKKQTAPAVPLTTEQLIANHLEQAEALLVQAGESYRSRDAEVRYAAMATAHATLAVGYQMSVASK